MAKTGVRRRLVRVALVGLALLLVLLALPQTRRAVRSHLSVRGVLALVGLRAETSGSGRPRSLALDRLEEHYRELEARRARDQASSSASTSNEIAKGVATQGTPQGTPATVTVASAPPASAAEPTLSASATPAGQPNVPSTGVPLTSHAPATATATATAGELSSAPAASWPDFRGPRRDGRYSGPDVLTRWPESGLRELWRTPIGGGYASMTTAQGRLYTIEQRRSQEVVAAYDAATGRELWTNAWEAFFTESMGGDGPRATPVFADGRVYALGAQGELRSLDAQSGRTIWRTNILADSGAENLQWGMAASPLVLDDVVVVLPGGARGQSVIAYDKSSGERRWAALDEPQAYVAPMDVVIDGVRQLLIVTASRALGLSLDDRSVLWSFPWVTDHGINSSQPIVFAGTRVFLSAGYGHGAAVIEVRRAGESFQVTPVWQNVRMKNKFTSSVLHDGFIYGLDEAILACVDASTGELKWKGGRYGYGQLVLVKDQLWVTTEDGDMVQVAATPERHMELARFKALDGKTWNHPIVSGGRLFVRNQSEMAAYDVRPSTPASQP